MITATAELKHMAFAQGIILALEGIGRTSKAVTYKKKPKEPLFSEETIDTLARTMPITMMLK